MLGPGESHPPHAHRRTHRTDDGGGTGESGVLRWIVSVAREKAGGNEEGVACVCGRED